MRTKLYILKRIRGLQALGFIVLIALLTYLSAHKALAFGFWRDDWSYAWALKVANDLSIYENSNVKLFFPLHFFKVLFLTRFFDLNPFRWQVTNLILRFFASFAGGLLVHGLTRKKLASVFTVFFLATGVAGIEPASWFSANYAISFIIPLSLAFYFWVTSWDELEKKEGKSRYAIFYFLSVLLFAVLVKGQAWSYYLIPTMAIVWDLMMLVQKRNKSALITVLIRLSLMIFVLIAIYPMPPTPYSLAKNSGFGKLKQVTLGQTKNLFGSLGNLTLGSFVNISESAGLSRPYNSSVISGYVVIIITFVLGIRYIFRPNRKTRALLYLFIWMIIFYFPRWVFESTITVGASHRYLTISSLGIYGAFSYILSLLKNRRTSFILALLFILVNIHLSNKVLAGLLTFRSRDKIQSVVSSISEAIPVDQKDFAINYAGDGLIRGYILDWSLGIPIAIERNISDRTKFPIWGIRKEKAEKLICGEKVAVNLIGKGETYERGGYKFSKDQIYSFYVKDSGEVVDKSEEFRASLDDRCLKI